MNPFKHRLKIEFIQAIYFVFENNTTDIDIYSLNYHICFFFLDSTKGCHIDCSTLSTAPPSSHTDSVYRITSIEVNLLSFTNGFNMQTPCFNSNPSLNIRIGCEGEFIHSNVLFENFNIL